MAVKPIVLYSKNEAALRKKSETVQVVNRRVKKIIKDLKDTLIDADNGIGLAAPQINVHLRIIAIRLGGDANGEKEAGPPVVLINPEIVEEQNPEKGFDGCLSFPGLFANTVRPRYLHVKGLDEWGKPFDSIFKGFDAVLIHHEIDHINGVLFIDRVTQPEDLYTIREDEDGNLVKVPVGIGR